MSFQDIVGGVDIPLSSGMKFTVEGKYATGGTDSFQLVGGLMLDLHEKKAPLISQKMEEKSLELERTEAQSTVTPKAEKQVEESQRLAEQPIVAKRVAPGSKEYLRIILDKKPNDLTDADINELLKQKRNYAGSVQAWSWLCGTSLGIGLGCAISIPSTKDVLPDWRTPLIVIAVISSAIGIISISPLVDAIKWNNEIEDKIELMKVKQGTGLLQNEGFNLVTIKYRF